MKYLELFMKVKNYSQSDIARMAGVSKQAVSKWFASKKFNAQPRLNFLLKICEQTGLSLNELITPIPELSEKNGRKRLEALLLWDKLFESLEDFFIALCRHNPQALARLVQTMGMFNSVKILGRHGRRVIFLEFEKYKKYLHPRRRQECELLCDLQKNLGLI